MVQQEVNAKVGEAKAGGEAGLKQSMTKTTQAGFGRSSATRSYEKAANLGLDQEYTFRARAVALVATIDTSHLTSCDLAEYFVTDVLMLAKKVAPSLGATLASSDRDALLDAFMVDYGTHLPTKFELGCEATRAYRFSSAMDESVKRDSINKASKSGFDVFGFSSHNEQTGFEYKSNEHFVSDGESLGSTQITCGSGSSLVDFCDSVAMNNRQSHLPHLLTVDDLAPIWHIMSARPPPVPPPPRPFPISPHSPWH